MSLSYTNTVLNSENLILENYKCPTCQKRNTETLPLTNTTEFNQQLTFKTSCCKTQQTIYAAKHETNLCISAIAIPKDWWSTI